VGDLAEAARGRLDRLEVPVVDGARAYERLDFGDDLGFERRFEATFFAAFCEAASGASNWASHNCSLACTNPLARARKRVYRCQMGRQLPRYAKSLTPVTCALERVAV